MAEFDPRQLDQLEDALESLAVSGEDDLESLDLPPEVLERLSEYRDVLALCRDAFPLESPPDDMLTVVLDEAREVSRRPRSRDADRRGGWRRVWERWRGTVVPGLALATTAVVVLLVLDPATQTDSASELSTEKLERAGLDRRSDAELERTQPASEMPTADEPRAVPPMPEPTVEQRTNTGEAGNGAGEAGNGAPDQRKQAEPKPAAGGKPSKSKLANDDLYEPAVAPEPAPMNKDETWSTFERADSARHRGDCDQARSLYEQVISASSDAQAKAKAKAGIGLCFEQDHRNSEATKWFNEARADSPAIDAWINSERDEQPLPGEAKKAKSKKDLPAPEADATAL